MDDVPLALLGSLLTGAVTVGSAWGVVRASIKSLARDQEKFELAVVKRLDRLEATADEHNKVMHEGALQARTMAARLSDISELKQSAVRGDVFAIRMSAQDEMLHAQDEILAELRLALDTKASRRDMPAAKALPPMRGRLPSKPIDREDR